MERADAAAGADCAAAVAAADGYCSREILDYVVANGDEWNYVVNKAKYAAVEEILPREKENPEWKIIKR